MAPSGKPTKVITGEVRLSYVHLLEPYTNDPDQPPKFSTVIMIPKSDKTTIKKLRAAQQAALENAADRLFNGKIPRTWHDTVKDGDDDEVLEKNPEYEGHWVLNASAKTKPSLVDRALDPILDSSEIYSGMFARISMNAFAYKTKGNTGVSFGLNHVQKLRDGDFFGGRSRAEDDFEAIDEDDEEGLI